MSSERKIEPHGEGGPEEPSALVFRVGSLVMCASALDVEGIIERPKMLTALPFMPDYALGSFLFRNHAATAISLRRKFGIPEGEGAARAPFIAACIGADVFAFCVDEVKDLIDTRALAWQPMPPILAGGLFDCYTIKAGALILHTRFEDLLNAKGGAQATAAWAAQHAVAAVGAPVVAEEKPVLEQAATTPGAVPAEVRADASVTAGPEPEKAKLQEHAVIERVGSRVVDAAVDTIRVTPARGATVAVPSTSPSHYPTARDAWPSRSEAPRSFDISTEAPSADAPAEPAPAPHRARSAVFWLVGGLLVSGTIAALLLTLLPREQREASQVRAVAESATAGTPRAEPAPGRALPLAIVPPAKPEPPLPVQAPALERDSTVAPTTTIRGESFTMTIERGGVKGEKDRASPDTGSTTIVHRVVRGDMLSVIALKYLGNGRRYPELARLSEIDNPDLIYPGDIVRIELKRSQSPGSR